MAFFSRRRTGCVLVLQLVKLLVFELRAGQFCKVDWLRDGLDAGKGVCYDVVPPGNVANISRKLPDVVQVVELARGALIGLQSEGEGKRLVVSEYCEMSTFNHVSEVLD